MLAEDGSQSGTAGQNRDDIIKRMHPLGYSLDSLIYELILLDGGMG